MENYNNLLKALKELNKEVLYSDTDSVIIKEGTFFVSLTEIIFFNRIEDKKEVKK